MDFDGRPVGRESDFPLAGKVGGLQGVGVAANDDVWIADATKNQMLHFPGGRLKDARLVQVNGLKSPFGVAIDAQNRVWVSNAQSDTVVRFPANDPHDRRAVGDDRRREIERHVARHPHLVKTLTPGKTTGMVNMIRDRCRLRLCPTGPT